jgi:hypothetical protein
MDLSYLCGEDLSRYGKSYLLPLFVSVRLSTNDNANVSSYLEVSKRLSNDCHILNVY